jgi:hypothetical protein
MTENIIGSDGQIKRYLETAYIKEISQWWKSCLKPLDMVADDITCCS